MPSSGTLYPKLSHCALCGSPIPRPSKKRSFCSIEHQIEASKVTSRERAAQYRAQRLQDEAELRGGSADPLTEAKADSLIDDATSAFMADPSYAVAVAEAFWRIASR